MKVLRTPDDRFDGLSGYNFAPHYLTIKDSGGTELRVHYIDEGPRDGQTVLLMHGEPSWCYLYRTMIPGLLQAGFRVVAPDLIGFGRSDKPAERSDYTYAAHIDWMSQWLAEVDLHNAVLFCQDWGGLIGLRLVAEHGDRFAGVVAGNTFLPTGDKEPGQAFLDWQAYSQNVPEFPVGNIIQGATVSNLSDEIIAGYDAPFPDESYKSGARQFPMLVPTSPDNPESQANREAWQVLKGLTIPVLTCFSDKDPVTAGGDKSFQKMLPGCDGQKHITIRDGGHFLQEDQGPQLAEVIAGFISDNQIGK